MRGVFIAPLPYYIDKLVRNIELHLTSEIPPSVNHYLAYRGVMKNGRPRAMSYKTQEAVQYRRRFAEYVTEQVAEQGWDRVPDKDQHFYVDAVFYFDKRRMDCNNYFKVMLDAITDTQLIWLDDDVTCERVQRIYYDSENPRIELTIRPVDYVGIFDDESQANEFVSVCFGCARYQRNCSLLRKALIGKIQREIYEGECTKYTKKKEIREINNGKEEHED